MPPQDILKAIRQRPFVPFIIHVTDGTTCLIRHPEMVLVGLGSAVVGVPPPGQADPYYDHYETVDMRHIQRLVPAPTGQQSNSA